MFNKESEENEQEDVDAAIEEAINKTARIKRENKSFQELIASIIVDQHAITTPPPATTKKFPTQLPEHPTRENRHDPLKLLHHHKY